MHEAATVAVSPPAPGSLRAVPPDAVRRSVTLAVAPARAFALLTPEHRGFERHGEGGDAYRDGLDSPQGWTFMLDRYVAAAAG
jgi:hypothetical protein